jgi:tetratricopeptide (TPR) repeat protein
VTERRLAPRLAAALLALVAALAAQNFAARAEQEGAAPPPPASANPPASAGVSTEGALSPDYVRGKTAATAGDCAAALPALEAAVESDPESLRYASDYRQTVIACGEYDRSLAFFERLVAAHPDSPGAVLNYGYAYVDKIPSAGAISQVILADRALKQFSRALELKTSWLALYTRGNAYLYWPKVFGRGPLAVADLEQAVEMSRGKPDYSEYVRAYVALGDAYWRTDQPEKARATWKEGLARFPDDPKLAARMARDGDELDRYIFDEIDPNRRVDTDLTPVWSHP